MRRAPRASSASQRAPAKANRQRRWASLALAIARRPRRLRALAAAVRQPAVHLGVERRHGHARHRGDPARVAARGQQPLEPAHVRLGDARDRADERRVDRQAGGHRVLDRAQVARRHRDERVRPVDRAGRARRARRARLTPPTAAAARRRRGARPPTVPRGPRSRRGSRDPRRGARARPAPRGRRATAPGRTRGGAAAGSRACRDATAAAHRVAPAIPPGRRGRRAPGEIAGASAAAHRDGCRRCDSLFTSSSAASCSSSRSPRSTWRPSTRRGPRASTSASSARPPRRRSCRARSTSARAGRSTSQRFATEAPARARAARHRRARRARRPATASSSRGALGVAPTETVVTRPRRAAAAPRRSEDLRPLPRGDRRGLSSLFAVIGTLIPSLVFGVLLSVFGRGLPARVRWAAVLVFAAVARASSPRSTSTSSSARSNGHFLGIAARLARCSRSPSRAAAHGLGRLGGPAGIVAAIAAAAPARRQLGRRRGHATSSSPVLRRGLAAAARRAPRSRRSATSSTSTAAATLAPVLALSAWAAGGLAFGLLGERFGPRTERTAGMKVFVAGASGAIGRQLVPLLVGGRPRCGGHRPRSARSARAIDAPRRDARWSPTGSTATSLVERDRRRRARGRRPPDDRASPASPTTATSTRRSRSPTGCAPRAPTTCSRARAPPARAASWRRASATGTTSARAARSRPRATRSTPTRPTTMRRTLEAIRHLERRSPTTPALDGVALRYANLYGPGTSYRRGRRRRRAGAPAAAADHRRRRRRVVVRARRRRRGRDARRDRARRGPASTTSPTTSPRPRSDWLPGRSPRRSGAKPPRHVPAWLGRLAAGEAAVSMFTEIRGASNAKARRELRLDARRTAAGGRASGASCGRPSWRHSELRSPAHALRERR